ncbi:MAG: SusC/RagA family TonB-linked outer membrane protein, partial [Mariniphaga sp.]
VTKKSDLTGSVVSIDSKSLERQTATNVTELLRSALPGLNVGTSTSASGVSGLEVRGPTSLGTSNSPLIVVDDVIYQGSIANINPNDIETVDVLKDASSAAIYGSKSAAGVIIITTKKGTSAKPTINVRSTVGMAQVNKMEEVYGPEGYLQLRRDVLDRFDVNSPLGYYSNPSELPAGVTLDQWLEYDNLGGTTTPAEDIWLGRLQLQQIEVDNYKAGNTLDWKDIMFQSGLRTDNNVSLSGKTNSLSYYTSLGYVSNEGISIYQKYQSFRGRVNLEAKVNKFLSVGVNLQGNENTQPIGVPGAVGLYESNSPYGSLYYDDGTYRHDPHDDAMGDNPYLYEYLDNHYKVREAFLNIYGKITLPYGFSYKVNWVNRYAFNQNYRFTPSTYTQGDGGDSGSRSEGTSYSWMVDNILKWNKTIADIHDFDLTFLYNVEEYSAWNSSQSNADFDPNESLSYHNLSIGASPQIGSNDVRSTGDALMARLNYGLLDRYLLTLSIRRDGYSAFGQENPRATFPAVALGWRLSEEGFINADWLTNLKLRLSYGENGNREIGRYSALSRMTTTKYIYDHSSVTGIYTTNLANKELKWERTAAYNVGIDYAILDGKISGTIDIYQMNTTD